MDHTTIVAGVDVSKAHLDLAFWPSGEAHRVANTGKGIAELGRLMRAARVERVAYEPTGPYHLAMERALHQAGWALVRINPGRARRFAEATGALAKTDRIDAFVLAQMAAALGLAPSPVLGENLRRLKGLIADRQVLTDLQVAERNRLQSTEEPLWRKLTAARLALLERQRDGLDGEIAALCAADPALTARQEQLMSVPGIGRLSAIVLLAEMPELGTMTGSQAASLAGLAPVANDSGSRSGKRMIRGGRGQLRRALYMPALVAARKNPAMRRVYERLVAAGKPKKLALTAVMRKLVVLANALLRDGTSWTEKPA